MTDLAEALTALHAELSRQHWARPDCQVRVAARAVESIDLSHLTLLARLAAEGKLEFPCSS